MPSLSELNYLMILMNWLVAVLKWHVRSLELTAWMNHSHMSWLHLSMQRLVALMWWTQSMTSSSHQPTRQPLGTSPLLMMMCWNLMSSSLQNLILTLRLQITGMPERESPALPSSGSLMMIVSCTVVAQSPITDDDCELCSENIKPKQLFCTIF